MPKLGRVVLYRVGRNLNRAYRTCSSFGAPELALCECDEAQLSGGLYGCAGSVRVVTLDALPGGANVAAFETWRGASAHEVAWEGINTVVIGGETSGLPSRPDWQRVTIPVFPGAISLTVEAALAIALYEWRRYVDSHYQALSSRP